MEIGGAGYVEIAGLRVRVDDPVQRVVLARIAARAPLPLGTADLASVLGVDPVEVQGQIDAYLAAIRRMLEAAGGRLVRTSDGGFRVVIDPASWPGAATGGTGGATDTGFGGGAATGTGEVTGTGGTTGATGAGGASGGGGVSGGTTGTGQAGEGGTTTTGQAGGTVGGGAEGSVGASGAVTASASGAVTGGASGAVTGGASGAYLASQELLAGGSSSTLVRLLGIVAAGDGGAPRLVVALPTGSALDPVTAVLVERLASAGVVVVTTEMSGAPDGASGGVASAATSTSPGASSSDVAPGPTLPGVPAGTSSALAGSEAAARTVTPGTTDDTAGTARLTGTPGGDTPPADAPSLPAVLDRAGADRVDLFAKDTAALAVLELAARQPERVGRLVLDLTLLLRGATEPDRGGAPAAQAQAGAAGTAAGQSGVAAAIAGASNLSPPPRPPSPRPGRRRRKGSARSALDLLRSLFGLEIDVDPADLEASTLLLGDPEDLDLLEELAAGLPDGRAEAHGPDGRLAAALGFLRP